MSAIGLKQTCACAPHMPAFDPKRTFPLAWQNVLLLGLIACATRTVSAKLESGCLSNQLTPKRSQLLILRCLRCRSNHPSKDEVYKDGIGHLCKDRRHQGRISGL